MWNESLTLHNGVTIPQLGLGTWEIADDKVADVVKAAIQMGYRHIDTAQAYENERGVGEGIAKSGVDRKELFVTTKVEAEIRDYDEALQSVEDSLERLGLDYVDLLLIHSPQPWDDFRSDRHYFEENVKVWQALEKLYKEKKTRAIGISNFEVIDIDYLFDHATIKPMVNQILAHISNTPFDVIKHSQEKGMIVEAYSPIAHGEILHHPEIVKMADKYHVSVPQLCIRYGIELGLVTLPKSENPAHIKSNGDVNFEISAEDLEVLKMMERIENYGQFDKYSVFKHGINQ
nr:aldo/keto reductase [Allofustis seminis]